MRIRVFAVAAILLLSVIPIEAQIGESMTIEVVEVPVYVSRNGKAVRGLTKDDFTLRVNGKVQAIDYFDAVDRRAADARMPELNRRRMTMLLFDLTHTWPWALRRAQQAATAFIDQSQPYDSYAIASLTPRGIYLLVPFTNDRVNVRRAIASLKASRAGDAFGLATTTEERALWSRGVAEWSLDRQDQVVGNDPMFSTPVPLELDLNQQLRVEQRRDIVRQLGELAEAMRPLEGQKSVILLSQGMQAEGDTAFGNVFGYAQLRDMHKSFRTAGVILNAVDLTGLAGPFDAQPGSLLFDLTLDTGGYVEHSRNNFLNALRDIEDMESIVYILGFHPPPSDKKTNSIRVKVRDAGLFTSVRYRKAYASDRPDAGAMSSMMLADVLLNDIPQHGVSIGADVLTADEGAAITVSVPGNQVLAYVGGANAVADVYFYVFDKENVVASWGEKRVTIPAGESRDFLEKNPLRIAQAMRLAPGHYVAKVLFRLRGSGATGFTRTEFDVGG